MTGQKSAPRFAAEGSSKTSSSSRILPVAHGQGERARLSLMIAGKLIEKAGLLADQGDGAGADAALERALAAAGRALAALGGAS